MVVWIRCIVTLAKVVQNGSKSVTDVTFVEMCCKQEQSCTSYLNVKIQISEVRCGLDEFLLKV